MKRLLLCVLASALVSACGAAGTGAAPSPTPGQTPIGPGDYAVVLSEQDHSATLHVGQKLEVALRAGSGMRNWSHPSSSDESVLAPTVDPAATAVRGVTLAAFVARAPGGASLTAISGPLCSPGQACPMYAIAYMATVTVTR